MNSQLDMFLSRSESGRSIRRHRRAEKALTKSEHMQTDEAEKGGNCGTQKGLRYHPKCHHFLRSRATADAIQRSLRYKSGRCLGLSRSSVEVRMSKIGLGIAGERAKVWKYLAGLQNSSSKVYCLQNDQTTSKKILQTHTHNSAVTSWR